MKNFERKDKNERRRVLLNKNYELSVSLDNEKLRKGGKSTPTGENSFARTDGAVLHATIARHIRAIIAVVVALCIVIPSVVGLIHVGATSRSLSSTKVRKDNAYVETSKTATPVDEDGDGVPDKYHIKLTAYNTAYSILGEPTDTMLVLERSSEMNKVLFTRDKTNLQTYTRFNPVKLNTITHNDLFDIGNPENSMNYFALPISNDYADRKFIEDPNTPGVYIYLAQRDVQDRPVLLTRNNYTYYITDTNGNTYISGDGQKGKPYSEYMIGTGAAQVLPMNKITNGITFYFDHGPNGETTPVGDNAKSQFTIDTIYTRNADDENALNERLYEEYVRTGCLWIKNNEGEWCRVDVERGPSKVVNNTRVYEYYKYTAHDDTNGKTYVAYYGNPEYGTQYSVFQGFKTYNADGTLDEENSLLHKSLYNNEGEEVTRLTAMKESTEEFVLDLYKNAHENDIPDGQQRLGIVSFASKTDVFNSQDESRLEFPLQDVKDEKTAYDMISTVYAFEGSGRRRVDRGLELAYDELQSNGNPSHKTNVITFTCGNPSSETNNKYETIYADAALAQKQIIDDWSNDATFYSIGLYEGADADQLYGDYFRRALHNPIPCDGSNGSFWGGTALASWTNPEMTEADVAATNRFLNYLSSNYTEDFSTTKYTQNAIRKLLYNLNKGYNIGIDGQKWILPNIFQYGLSTGGNGYEVVHETPNGAWSNQGYYNAATNGAELEQAFQNVADQLVVPMATLNEDTTLEDYCSDYFQIVPGTAQAYTVDRNDNPVSYEGTLDVTETDTGITVSGFNYSENYIASNHDGKKLVVEFDAVPIDGFLGGNQVPTNNGDSAIYDPHSTLVENFEVPKVDITPKTAMEVNDQYIYYTNETDLRDLFTVTDNVDGLRNDFVDLVYTVYDEDNNEVFSYYVDAGKTDEDGWFSIDGEDKIDQYPQLKDNTTYHVTCTSQPIYNGTETEQSDSEDAKVYIYKPVVTLQDTTKSYADAVAGVNLNENRVSVEWKAEDTDHAPEGTEPTLEYTFYNKDDNNSLVTDPISHSMTETTNYQVDVTIKGHDFTYTTNLPYYVKTDGTYVLVSDYTGDKSDLTPETYIEYDSQGNPTEKIVYELDEDGNETDVPVYKMVVQPAEITVARPDITDSDTDQHFTTYINQTDDSKTNSNTEGNFTVYTGKAYDLYVTKTFTGDYVNPEGVRFTLTGSDGSTQTLDIAANEFTRLTSGEKKVAESLRTGVTYTIEESFLEETEVVYNTTATQKTGSDAATDLQDTDANDGKAIFQFTVAASEDPGRVDIVVINADTSEPPVVTGVSEKEHTNYIWLIALASSATLSAGGYGMYRIKKND